MSIKETLSKNTEAMSSLYGIKYKLGGNGTDGIDCFGFITSYLEAVSGKEIKKEHRNKSISDYYTIYKSSPESAMRYFMEYLENICAVVDKNRVFIGDILFMTFQSNSGIDLMLNDHRYVVAVVCGPSVGMACSKQFGISSISLDGLKILRSWRGLKE